MKKKQVVPLTGTGMALAIFLVIFISFRISQPPAVVPAHSPDSLFSAERAAGHLFHIASKPNPIGSKANEEVMRYIMDQIENMGYEPRLQVTEYYYAQRAALLRNVMVRIPGSGSGKAILLMGHYDTVHTAPGASDNGAAVVTLLEVIRMLKQFPGMKNDLIFLFPDGEEVGLLGARAFMDEHPWAKDIAVVINFEAMGTGGMSNLFETGDGNLKIIREFARAVPFPYGNSLSIEIYNRMPNATDYEVFKKQGYQGLNFAYIDNSFDYHTGGDNIGNTDLRSIQHHGSYASALVLHLGNSDLDFESDQNAVYFNTIGKHFACYPYSRVPVITFLVLLIAAAIIITGIYTKKFNPLRLLVGLVTYLILLVILYALSDALFHIFSAAYPGGSFRLIAYNQQNILLGVSLMAAAFSAAFFHLIIRGIRLWHPLSLLALFIILLCWSGGISLLKIAIALAIAAWLFLAHRKPIRVWDLSAGAVLVWGILVAYTGFLVPGASFLFTWPLAFSLVPLGYRLFEKTESEKGHLMAILLLLFAIPVLTWFPMLMKLFQLAMGIAMLGISMLVAGLIMGLLVPHTHLITRHMPWLVPGTVCLTGLTILLVNTIRPDYDQRHRKQNTIIHASERSTGESYWFCFDSAPDEWTVQFLSENPDTLMLNRFFPHLEGNVPGKKADGPCFTAAALEVLADTVNNDERLLKIIVRPENHPGELHFFFDAGEAELSLRVGDLARYPIKKTGNTNWRLFRYLAPSKEGITLTLFSRPGQPIRLHLNEIDYETIPGLPDFSIRPPHMMNGGDRKLICSVYEF